MAVDINVTLPLSPSWVTIDVLGAISPQDPYVGYVSDWEDGSHGIVTGYEGRDLVYVLYGYADQSEYDTQKLEYEGKIEAWGTFHTDRIEAEFNRQRAALVLLHGFLTAQNQESSFWAHVSATTGAASFASGPLGIGATIASALSAVIAMHAGDPVPNFTTYWAEMNDKLDIMEAQAKSYIDANVQWMKFELIANLPSAVALTTDQFDYLFQNSAGEQSVGTITVNLGGRIDYYARLWGLNNNFSAIEPQIANPYRPVHTTLAIYGDVLLSYAQSTGLNVQQSQWYQPHGGGPPVYGPHWYSTDLGYFGFTGCDVAIELNAINFMRVGFEVYENI